MDKQKILDDLNKIHKLLAVSDIDMDTYNIVSPILIELKKNFKQGYEVSYVECGLCLNRWTAVRPEGTEKLECSNCGRITEFTNISKE